MAVGLTRTRTLPYAAGDAHLVQTLVYVPRPEVVFSVLLSDASLELLDRQASLCTKDEPETP